MQIISSKKMAVIEERLSGIEGLQSEVKALRNNIIAEQFSHLSQQIYPTWNIFKEIETYRIQDDIYSVVTLLAKTAAGIPMYGYNAAGEDLPETNKLAQWIKTFTYRQRLELYTWLFLTDECFIYKELLEFGPNAGVSAIHFLPPDQVTLVLSKDFPTKCLGYYYRDPAQGVELRLSTEDITFIKGINPTSDFYTKWRGLSNVKVLTHTLTRLKAGKDVSVAQLQNAGGKAIVYEEGGDFTTVETKGMRRDNYAKFVKNSDNVGAPYFAGGGKMGVLRLNESLADMNVAELAAIDFKKICNTWSISDRLFNNDATGSEISDTNAQKGLYNNAVAPTVTLAIDELNASLVPLLKSGEGDKIEADYSDIRVLQEDLLQKANALAAAPTMVPNDVQEAMGFERSDDPLMDIVYIKTGYQPLSDFNDIEPV